jgi:hypothetical protein
VTPSSRISCPRRRRGLVDRRRSSFRARHRLQIRRICVRCTGSQTVICCAPVSDAAATAGVNHNACERVCVIAAAFKPGFGMSTIGA